MGLKEQQEAGAAQVLTIELLESLVEDREASGTFKRRPVEAVIDGLNEVQQREMIVSLAEVASASIVSWRRHDVVGADIYLAMRRMFAGRMTGETDDHDHNADDHDED